MDNLCFTEGKGSNQNKTFSSGSAWPHDASRPIRGLPSCWWMNCLGLALIPCILYHLKTLLIYPLLFFFTTSFSVLDYSCRHTNMSSLHQFQKLPVLTISHLSTSHSFCLFPVLIGACARLEGFLFPHHHWSHFVTTDLHGDKFRGVSRFSSHWLSLVFDEVACSSWDIFFCLPVFLQPH